MLIIDWLKWYFIPSGIACIEESGQLSWLKAFKTLVSGGVPRRSDGPTDQMHLGFARVGKKLKRYKCKFCSVYFWSWKRPRRDVCYRWSCYRGV